MHKNVEELTRAFGFNIALAVVRGWGGRDWSVPLTAAPDSPIALTLGLEVAQRIVALWGGQKMQLPDERHALMDLRNDAIWREVMVKGRSQAAVSLDFGLSRQGVAMVINRMLAERGRPDTPAEQPAATPQE